MGACAPRADGRGSTRRCAVAPSAHAATRRAQVRAGSSRWHVVRRAAPPLHGNGGGQAVRELARLCGVMIVVAVQAPSRSWRARRARYSRRVCVNRWRRVGCVWGDRSGATVWVNALELAGTATWTARERRSWTCNVSCVDFDASAVRPVGRGCRDGSTAERWPATKKNGGVLPSFGTAPRSTRQDSNNRLRKKVGVYARACQERWSPAVIWHRPLQYSRERAAPRAAPPV